MSVIVRSKRTLLLFVACAVASCSKAPPATPPSQDEIPSLAREISLRPDQVHFDRAEIATTVRPEQRPASRLRTHPAPAYLLLILDPATLADPAWPEARALIVYPAADWSKTYARLGRANRDPVAALARLLDHEPQNLGIEFPPTLGQAGARQIVQSAVKYFKFHKGRGVRFLTVFQADPLPVADRDVVYVFHGLTDDGRFWVTLNYPVTARVLPGRDAVLAQLGDYDRFVAGHGNYVAELARKLDAARLDDFTPRLDRIDAMLASLAIDD